MSRLCRASCTVHSISVQTSKEGIELSNLKSSYDLTVLFIYCGARPGQQQKKKTSSLFKTMAMSKEIWWMYFAECLIQLLSAPSAVSTQNVYLVGSMRTVHLKRCLFVVPFFWARSGIIEKYEKEMKKMVTYFLLFVVSLCQSRQSIISWAL